MMAMFLRCLRYVLGGQGIPRESALWWSRRDYPPPEDQPLERPRVFYGLGFSNTLSDCPRMRFEDDGSVSIAAVVVVYGIIFTVVVYRSFRHVTLASNLLNSTMSAWGHYDA